MTAQVLASCDRNSQRQYETVRRISLSLEAKGQQRVSMGAPLFEHGQLSAFSCRMQGASPAIPVLGGLALLANHAVGRRALSGPEDELIAVDGLP